MKNCHRAVTCLAASSLGLLASVASAAVAPGNWTPTYSDDFNQGGSSTAPNVQGSYPDLAAFTYDTGGGGWGNGESETYTKNAENVSVSGGMLHITGIKTVNGGTTTYTSARLKSNYTQTYGLFEWRAATPAGQGLWPALWMMGTSSNSWPQRGETDVMETKGQSPTLVQGTLHSSADGSGANGPTRFFTAPTGFSTNDFHVYSLEWDPADLVNHPGTNAVMKWYIDGSLYATQYPKDAAYKTPFFMLMNMAMGGSYAGSVTNLPAGSYDFQVDYIHVYAAAVPEPASLFLLTPAALLFLRRSRRTKA